MSGWRTSEFLSAENVIMTDAKILRVINFSGITPEIFAIAKESETVMRNRLFTARQASNMAAKRNSTVDVLFDLYHVRGQKDARQMQINYWKMK